MSVMVYVVFFFKQKTAYEMRISDWSSDVCSSDLDCLEREIAAAGGRNRTDADELLRGRSHGCPQTGRKQHLQGGPHRKRQYPRGGGKASRRQRRNIGQGHRSARGEMKWRDVAERFDGMRGRSEEHTSELQSLMRISYAVFCLNTKPTNHNTTHI